MVKRKLLFSASSVALHLNSAFLEQNCSSFALGMCECACMYVIVFCVYECLCVWIHYSRPMFFLLMTNANFDVYTHLSSCARA